MRILSKDSEKILEFLDKFKIDKNTKINIGSNTRSIYKNVVSSLKQIDEQHKCQSLLES